MKKQLIMILAVMLLLVGCGHADITDSRNTSTENKSATVETDTETEATSTDEPTEEAQRRRKYTLQGNAMKQTGIGLNIVVLQTWTRIIGQEQRLAVIKYMNI